MGVGNFSYSYKTYLFDLDNTLYNENDYLFGAYNFIAKDISKITGGDYKKITDEIIALYQKEGRADLFNKLNEKYNLRENSISDFIEILRTVKLNDKLVLFPNIKIILNDLVVKNKQIIIITNGNPQQQQNKLNQLDWNGLELKMEFILANEIDKKPSKRLFDYLKAKYNIIEESTLMIGDSILDEIFAKNSNINFINVKFLM